MNLPTKTEHGGYQSLTPSVAQLVDVVEDGQDTRRYRFQLLSASTVEIQPGQFFMLSIPGMGEAPFTYTQMPDRNGVFGALVRKMGAVTEALFECESGALVGIRGPFGKGWPLQQLQSRNVLIFAGGCGLAPLVTAIEALLCRAAEHKLALVYGARDRVLQMLNHQRQQWARQIPVFDVLERWSAPAADQSEAVRGNLLEALPQITQRLNWQPDAVLLCGPEVMMESVGRELINRGLSADSIWLSIERRMHCAVGLCGHCYLNTPQLAHHYVCRDGPTYRWDQLFNTNPEAGEQVL